MIAYFYAYNEQAYLILYPTIYEFENVSLVQIELTDVEKRILNRDNWLELYEEQLKTLFSTPKS